MATLSPGERKAYEESQLQTLRIVIEQTMGILDPSCSLNLHLQETMGEIRCHSLAELLPRKARQARQARQDPRSRASHDMHREISIVPRYDSPVQPYTGAVNGFYQPSVEMVEPTADDGLQQESSEAIENINQSSNTTEDHQGSVPGSNKRRVGDDEELSPVSKRVKTWLSQLKNSYIG
ncbi:hypothetical protein FZEAL_3491 [Fusarium zealandicum]|uniref:Uncharacterized protein n=1 Tax=Fusarium zealandicum TaxID=1053134 RepID=A0A8H4UPA2_9HYPO|nr:hypothetical protein FZEAL_3491 [Fusarium zealandicum]